MSRRPAFQKSGILVFGENSIQSLVPSTLISQVEVLLDAHRIQDAAKLAEQQHKRLNGMTHPDPDETEELRYIYQRIGFLQFSETSFEDAGRAFLLGDLDPAILISYFSSLRGSLIQPLDTRMVFAGVADKMPSATSIDDIIRNYSPHLPPNTRSAPSTTELRNVLSTIARDMLETFLRQTRVKPMYQQSNRTKMIMDTVLAKIFAESEKTTDLYALIHDSQDILLEEVEPVLKTTGQYNALCMLYQQRGDDLKLLEAWSKLIDGEWIDEEIPDPLSDMFTLLTSKKDKSLTRKWAVWLMPKDSERALKLITSSESNKRRGQASDDLEMLRQIQEVDNKAGGVYLEHLVLQKRSINLDLHTELALSLADQLIEALQDEGTTKLWRAKTSSYASSKNEMPFLSYFASTTPDSEHKRIRLKAVIFLQGSSLYNVKAVHSKLEEHSKLLPLETAILEGRLSRHQEALTMLVHILHDRSSAEAYCTLGGEVVPAKIAQAVGEQYGLSSWSTVLFGPSSGPIRAGAAPAMERQRTVDEGTKKRLLRVLLEVYMHGGESMADRTARLLDSQAINLDVVDVVSLIPSDWPVQRMSSFITRSLRRSLHLQHEGQIVKAISTGQNLQVFDDCFPVLRDAGAIVEEEEEGEEEEVLPDEKVALVEKSGPNTESNQVVPIKVERETADDASDNHLSLT